jgi:hypothetical protein
MMKLLLFTLAALLAAARFASAQYVVTNPVSDALSEVMHVEDIAKWVESIENQVQQINTLTQQLQQVQAYVKAFGNPEQLTSIVGADQLIGSLQQTGLGQTLGEIRQLSNGTAALGYTGNGLYQSLGTSFSTPGGTQFQRDEELYRPIGAIQQGSQNFQTVSDDVKTRRETLRQEIAATTQQLQSATTDAETQKLTGVLSGEAAELAAVDREIDQAAAELNTQDIENRTEKDRQEQARREERQAQMQEATQQFGQLFQLDTSAATLRSR